MSFLYNANAIAAQYFCNIKKNEKQSINNNDKNL